MRYHVIPVRTAIIKKIRNKDWWGCGKKETLVHCWWECKLVQSLQKTVWSFLKKLKLKLLYDPAIPLLDIYLKKRKTLIWKDKCTPVFIAALFTIAKIWKQPKCPSIDEWIKKKWYTHAMEYYSSVKKEWNLVIWDKMDGPGGYYAKWNKSDKERQILQVFTYMWN